MSDGARTGGEIVPREAAGRDAGSSVGGLTVWLGRVAGGDEHAFEALVDLAYERLHAVAAARLRGRFGARAEAISLGPTMLADDVVIRLMQQRQALANTDHFFAIATRLMLNLITDYQRERLALKRGGGQRGGELPAEQVGTGSERQGNEECVLDAIRTLHEADSRAAEVAVLHAIRGHSLEQIAEALGLSHSTVKRDWSLAKAWLAKSLSESKGAGDAGGAL